MNLRDPASCQTFHKLVHSYTVGFMFPQCAFANNNGGPLTLRWREFRSCPRICPSTLCYPLEYAGRETGIVVQKVAWGDHAFPSDLTSLPMLLDPEPLNAF